MSFSFDNPLLLISLAMIANFVFQAAIFGKLVTLGNRLVSLYKQVSEMDEDNQIDPDEVSAAIKGVGRIKQDLFE